MAKQNPLDKRIRGNAAEDAACALLVAHQLKIVERNYDTKYGEIDIIAIENKTYVFVEVRFRENIDFGTSIETITQRKLAKTLKAIKHYLIKNKLYDKIMYRIDVIGFDFDLSNPQWIKNITQ